MNASRQANQRDPCPPQTEGHLLEGQEIGIQEAEGLEHGAQRHQTRYLQNCLKYQNRGKIEGDHKGRRHEQAIHYPETPSRTRLHRQGEEGLHRLHLQTDPGLQPRLRETVYQEEDEAQAFADENPRSAGVQKKEGQSVLVHLDL